MTKQDGLMKRHFKEAVNVNVQTDAAAFSLFVVTSHSTTTLNDEWLLLAVITIAEKSLYNYHITVKRLRNTKSTGVKRFEILAQIFMFVILVLRGLNERRRETFWKVSLYSS